MLPMLIIGGVFQGIAGLISEKNSGFGLALVILQISNLAFSFAIPIAAAYTAFSVADRPALIPAFVVGYFACHIGTGFLGAIIGALIIGLTIKLIRQIQILKEFKSIKTMLVLPLISTAAASAILYFILRIPLESLRNILILTLNGLDPILRFLLGAILSGIIAIDMGGKKGNMVAIFANASLAEGVPGPTSAKIIAAMVPPLILVIANLLDPKVKKDQLEYKNIRSLLFTGVACQITESVLPYAMQNPRKMITSCIAGSALAGGLVMYWNVLSPAPHGGLFLLPIINYPGYFLLALLVGSCSGALLLLFLRRFIKEKQPSDKKQELNDKDIWMNF
jgi:PTS system fructose-specific IIC component